MQALHDWACARAFLPCVRRTQHAMWLLREGGAGAALAKLSPRHIKPVCAASWGWTRRPLRRLRDSEEHAALRIFFSFFRCCASFERSIGPG